MLMVGDTVKMVKQIPGVPMIDGILEVIAMDNGSITIRGEAGYGMMSYQEYTEFFEKCERPLKRVWTDWMYDDSHDGHYKHNGKVVKYKIGGYKSKASCSPCDEFDLNTGKEIAYHRCMMKYHSDGVKIHQNHIDCRTIGGNICCC